MLSLFALHCGLFALHYGLFSIKPVEKWIIARKNENVVEWSSGGVVEWGSDQWSMVE